MRFAVPSGSSDGTAAESLHCGHSDAPSTERTFCSASWGGAKTRVTVPGLRLATTHAAAFLVKRTRAKRFKGVRQSPRVRQRGAGRVEPVPTGPGQGVSRRGTASGKCSECRAFSVATSGQSSRPRIPEPRSHPALLRASVRLSASFDVPSRPPRMHESQDLDQGGGLGRGAHRSTLARPRAGDQAPVRQPG